MAFVNLKFRKREATNYIYIVKKDLHGVGLESLRTKSMRRGGLDTGFHFIIRANGRVEADRVEYAYAGWWFEHTEKALAILIDTAREEEVSTAVQKAVKEIASKYPHAKIMEIKDAGDLED
jgi:hypothetical protein